MPIRTFVAGERPSSADFNRYFMQQHHVIKAASEQVTNSATLQPDNELIIPMEANTDYWMLGEIYYDASLTADLKMGWIFPAGCTMFWQFDGAPSGETSYNSCTLSRLWSIESSQPIAAGLAVATQGAIIPKGLVRNGPTAGNLTFRWAQGVAEATIATVRSGSLLILRRLTS